MVQIPQYQQQVGLDAPTRSGPQLDVTVDNSIGRGLQSLGGAITNVGEVFAQRQQRMDEFNTRVSWDALQEKKAQTLQEMARNATGDGAGFTDFYMKWQKEETSKWLDTVPNPELRAKYKTITDVQDGPHWMYQASDTEFKIGNTYTVNQLNAAKEKTYQSITADPASVTTWVKDMEERITKAPNLLPEQRQKLLDDVRQNGPKYAAEALKQTDPEALYFMSGRGTNEQRIDFLTRRLAPNLPGVTPERVKDAITKHGGDVSAALGDIADEGGVDEKDKAAFIEKGLSGMGPARLSSGKAGTFKTSAAGGGSAAQIIAKFEGFRSSTYWDVNHWRVGYGSDTITQADGTVVKVTKGMTVTRADAERDLQRRINETQAKLASDIGPAWENLSDGAKAALTSVAYNYGTLPRSVVSAAQGGDPAAISEAILGLKGHNGGVNSSRRRQEAAIAAGGAMPRGKVQLADASGTGGLTMNDAGPQYADGVPGSAPPVGAGEARSGFVSPVFQDLPAANLLDIQGTSTAAWTKAQQSQLAQQTADEILAMAGATADKAGDSKAAYSALDAIKDAEVRKDVAALVDSHFTRWTRIEKDQQEQEYKSVSSSVEQMADAGQTAEALKLVNASNLPAEDKARLVTRISKGPVQFDDPQVMLEVAGLKTRPEIFASAPLDRWYKNTLTPETINKLVDDQNTVKKALAGQGDDMARLQLETTKAANPIIENNLKSIGIDPSSKEPADVQHANLVRAMTLQEIEARQAKNGGRPLLLTEINDAVNSVMKTYPRFKPVESSWIPWRSADADVSMPEVLQAYDDAKLDVNQAAAALRKVGKPVNPATLQQALEALQATQK